MMETLTPSERRQFLDELVLPIFAHRRGKNLVYLKRFSQDTFTLVTDVCEGYSDWKMRTYFERPTLAFIFVWFSFKSVEGKDFAQKKFKSQRQHKEFKGYIESMMKGIETFGYKALECLREDDKSALGGKLQNYIDKRILK